MRAPVTQATADEPPAAPAPDPRGRARERRGLFSLVLLPERFPALHGARVIAIVSVMQVHLTNILFWGHIIPGGAFVEGSMSVWFGMDLFFMLSGFLIGSMLLHSEEALGARGVVRFYARRAFRIFPLYYLVLTFLAFRSPPIIFPKLLAGYLYVSNYSIYQPPIMSWAWSLCVEEHFYLLVPVLVALLRLIRSMRARLALLSALWVSGTAVRLYVLYAHAGPWSPGELFTHVYERTHTRYDVLIAGVTLAFVYRGYRERLERVFSRPRVRALAGAVVLALFALLYARPGKDPNLAWILSWGTETSLVYFVLFLLLIFGGGRVKSLLSARWFLFPATLGYGVYLIHIPVCESLVAPIAFGLALSGSPPLLTWAISLALLSLFCVAIAYALHLVIEKPILAIRDRFLP